MIVDVVIVGAGPVGLLTAIELTMSGARVVVLERRAEADMASKALGVGPLGVEALQRRGMAADIAAVEARRLVTAEQAGTNMRERSSKFSGHFAGLFLRKDAQGDPGRRIHMVDQQGVEAMLAARASALEIDVRRACDVTTIVHEADGVDVTWASPTGEGRTRCAYLVGCDGGRSQVRKMAGFAFPGTPPTMTMYTAIVEVDAPDQLMPVGWHRTSSGVFSFGAFPGRLFMLDFSGPPDDRLAPVTVEEIETVLRRVSGTDVRVDALASASRWTDNTRLVDTYRLGRVLLAGNAAHVHPPFGGQGLSLGLVDAANLGWKLAAVIRGEMPDALLETYTAERRPAAEAVLANTLAQTAIMRPDPQSGAVRDFVENLLRFDDVNRSVGAMVSGLSTRYDLGSDLDDIGRLIGDRPVGQGGGSLYEAMRDGVAVLLDASGGEASRLAAAITLGVRCIAVDSGPSMLIRPDACIAWSNGAKGADGLEDALRRWCPANDRAERTRAA